MLSVRPVDIANVCAVFHQLRSGRLPQAELARAICYTKALDCTAPGDAILGEAISCDLVTVDGNDLRLTETGKRVANAQGEPSTALSGQAADCLLRRVFLCIEVKGVESGLFLSRFRPDGMLGTFVFDRITDISSGDIQWLQRFHGLGLLDVDTECARVREIYLDLVNTLLKQIREGIYAIDQVSVGERNRIGDIAETHAMEYEKRRLERLARPELIPFVQQISKIDSSAGYDIRSFRATGKYPDQEIYVEVKGTCKPFVQFIWSYNERLVAKHKNGQYWLYLYTDVNVEAGTARGPRRINDPMNKITTAKYVIEPLDVRVSAALK